MNGFIDDIDQSIYVNKQSNLSQQSSWALNMAMKHHVCLHVQCGDNLFLD
jgi:hypothetical protein